MPPSITNPIAGSSYDQARDNFERACNQLRDSVSRRDAEIFQSTTLNEVKDAAKAIEARQRERRSMQNMARLKPFLDGLEKYSKVIEVLSNGTDYLPWIWAPIKMMLQIASEFTSVLDTLLNAYSQIADAMPDFSRIGFTFQDTPSVSVVLALIYGDILEFHRRAYKFLRRRSWHIFFDSLWKSFEGGKLHGILANFSRNRELLMKEVLLNDLIESKKARDIAKDQLNERERKKEVTHMHDSIAWLKIADEGQTDVLDQILEDRQEGTCEWVTKNPVFTSWKDDAHGEPIIWLNGIPGAGKTVLCSYVISCLQKEAHISAIFYICNSYVNGKLLLTDVLRSLAAQLLRRHRELAPYVFDNFANTGLAPSIAHLKNLLSDLLKTVPTVRMCIDGLDEFPVADQRKIMQELSALSKASNGQFRILLSSRDVTSIENVMRGKPLISLKTEEKAVESDIAAYVHGNLASIRADFEEAFVANIEQQVVMKAKGMFLWVRLILTNFEGCYSKRAVQNAVDQLPDGLDEAYRRILQRITSDLGSKDNSEQATRILEWIACSFRPLKVHEVQDGIVFDDLDFALDADSKINDRFFEQCKPLVQRGPNNTVEFVHLSAKEYVVHHMSGPFIQKSHAHYNIAFSCVLYLNTTFEFYDPAFNESVLKLRVLKGFHGLHHYANEFWLQHLLMYAKLNTHVGNADEMKEALGNLLEAWKNEPGSAHKALKLDDTTTQDTIESETEVLSAHGLIKDSSALHMGRDILTLRAFLSQEKYAHQEADVLKSLELKHDPTYFSDISQRYQEIAQFFINCNVDDLPPGGTPEMLDRFRAMYLDAAFICRYRSCPRFADGFKTFSDRDEHEKGHIKPLRCADPLCDLFERGFASRTGLIKHNRKYHPKPEDVEPPTFESISAPPAPVFVPPPPPPRRAPTSPRRHTPPPKEPKPPRVEVVKEVRVSKAMRGKLVHNCPRCPKVFTRAEGLRRHQVTHSAPTFECERRECEKMFHRKDLLERHLARHERKDELDHELNGAVGKGDLGVHGSEDEEGEEGDEEGETQDEENVSAVQSSHSIQHMLNM